MYKKLSLLVLVMLSFTLFLYACDKPYKNLKLTVSDSEVVLYLNAEEGSNVYINTTTLTASVTGAAKNVSTSVEFVQTGNAIDITNQTKSGTTTTVTFTAKNQGRSTVVVKTLEGNKKQTIEVVVYLKIESVDFVTTPIAVASVSSINLNNFLYFTPEDTNQKEMTFYIDHPNAMGSVFRNGYLVETNYAKIDTNGVLSIKNFVLAPHNGSNYYLSVVGFSNHNNELVTRQVVIPIINFVSDNEIRLYTNAETAAEEVELLKATDGFYEIVLGSNLVDNPFIFERELMFKIGINANVDQNYRVNANYSSTVQTHIEVLDETDHNFRQSFIYGEDQLETYKYSKFTISQKNVGTDTLNFSVDYYGYEGLFTKTIKVRVIVKQFPTTTLLTDRQGNAVNQNDVIDVFNIYGGNLLGTGIKVNASPSITGLTFSVNTTNASDLTIKTANNAVVVPSVTRVVTNNFIYLTHSYTADNLPTEQGTLTIVITYTMAPGSDTFGYAVYTLEKTIKLNYKIGLSSISVAPNLLINAVNRTSIDASNNVSNDKIFVSTPSTINLFESISEIRILTFNNIPVQNIAGFDLDPYSNIYFDIVYNQAFNRLEIEPNENGLSARMRIKVTTVNGYTGEGNITVFVPISYTSGAQTHIEIDNNLTAVFDTSQIGYNITIDPDTNDLVIKKSEEVVSGEIVRYDENGAAVVDTETQVPLTTTYFKTTGLNIATNAMIPLGLYNYITQYNSFTETTSYARINYANSVIVNNYSNEYFEIVTQIVNGETVKYLRTKNTPVANTSITFNFTGYNSLGVYTTFNYILNVTVTRPLEYITLLPANRTIYEKSSVGSLNPTSSYVDLYLVSNPAQDIKNMDNLSISYTLQNSVVYIYNYLVTTTDEFGIPSVSYAQKHFYASDVAELILLGNGDPRLIADNKVNDTSSSFYAKLIAIYNDMYNPSGVGGIDSYRFNTLRSQVLKGVYANTITVRVNVTAYHFGDIQLHSFVDVKINFAIKIDDIIIENIDEQGIYFDMRKSQDTKTITFYIMPANASNKRLIATITNTTVARISSGVSTGGVVTGNTITIERLTAGNAILTISAEDSFEQVTINGVVQNRAHVQAVIRIKVADGSPAFPFEIRSVSEFLEINNDYTAGVNNYHYVLTKDINLTGINFEPFGGQSGVFNGGFTGLFSYSNGGVYFSNQNTIYNLQATKGYDITISNYTNDYNFGMFGTLGSNAKINNINIFDANVLVNITNSYGVFAEHANIGILAGTNNANLNNIFVSGSVVVNSAVSNTNIGGYVGKNIATYNTVTNEVIGSITTNNAVLNSFNTDNINANVTLKLIATKNTNTNNNLNIGGVVGLSINNALSNQNLLQLFNNKPHISNLTTQATIYSYYDEEEEKLNGANAGGVVGKAQNLVLQSVKAYPFIMAYNNVGGLVGSATNSHINYSYVEFIDYGFIGLSTANLVATNNIGGLVGSATNSEISYSYVRSYYNKILDNLNYFGNILVVNGEDNTLTSNIYAGGLAGYLNSTGNITSLFKDASNNHYEAQTIAQAGDTAVISRNYNNYIKNSYFNAELNANVVNDVLVPVLDLSIVGNVYVGGLVGGDSVYSTNNVMVMDSYVIANIITQTKVESTLVTQDTEINHDDEQILTLLGQTIEYQVINQRLYETVTIKNNLVPKMEEGVPVLDIDNNPVYTYDTTTTQTITQLFGMVLGTEAFSINTTNIANVYTTTLNSMLTEGTVSRTYVSINNQSTNDYNLILDNYSKINFEVLSYTYEVSNSASSFAIDETSYNLLTSVVTNNSRLQNNLSFMTNIANYNARGFEVVNLLTNNFRYIIQLYDINLNMVAEFTQIRDTVPQVADYVATYPQAQFIHYQVATIWTMYENLNYNMPLLYNPSTNKLLYKVLPSSITAVVQEFDTSALFNNKAFVKVSDNAVVLFYNQRISGQTLIGINEYLVVKTDESVNTTYRNKVIEVNLNINLNANATVQPEIDGNLNIISSNSSVVEVLNGGIIKTKALGVTTLRISSRLNPNIYTTIEVLVVTGFSDYNLYSSKTLTTQNILTDADIVDLYVDVTKDMFIAAKNTLAQDNMFASYMVNADLGAYVEVIELSTNNGSVMLNDVLLQVGQSYVFNTLSEFFIKGVALGDVVLRITPFIHSTHSNFTQTLTGTGNGSEAQDAILVTSLSKNYNFKVLTRASSINTNNVTGVTISPMQTTSLTVSVITSAFTTSEDAGITTYIPYEKLNLRLFNYNTNASMGSVLDLAEGLDAEELAISDNFLLVIEYVSYNIEEILNASGQLLEIRVNYNINISFDTQKYKEVVSGINKTIKNEYRLQFYPNTNTELFANYNVFVIADSLSQINASFYASNEFTTIGNQNSFYPQENSTNYIAPGRVGLLKLYLFPEYNDAEYVELTINESLKNYVTYTQMREVYASNIDSYITGYSQISQNTIMLEGNNGIRLRNESYYAENSDNTMKAGFNGSYFVQVLLSAVIQEDTPVTFTITAYKTVGGVKTALAPARTLNLTAKPLPSVSLSVNGQSEAIVAIGQQIELTITAVNFEGNINFTKHSNYSPLTSFNVQLINGKYYLFVTENATLGDELTIVATASRFINGIEEVTSPSEVRITVVEYIINGVYVNGYSSGSGSVHALEILNGTSNELSVSVNANYTPNILENQIQSSITLFENVVSGKLPINITTNEYTNYWFLRQTISGNIEDSTLGIGQVYGNIFKFDRITNTDYNQTTYYTIKGMQVNNGSYRLVFKLRYYYDTTGKPQPYTNQAVSNYYETEFVFNLIIKDNSTYDHPNPVSTQQEFYNMQPSVHYILINDITFDNYVPFVANFGSLDGNGFVITINNFDLTSITQNATSATAGLFTTINNLTIVKNITLNIGPLLIGRTQANNIINTTNPEIQAQAKINLSGVNNVTFGLIAGINSGTITNAKVVNISNSNTNIDNKVLFIYTTPNFINTNEVYAEIGGLVGVNNGTISNSFVGQNYYTINNSGYNGVSKIYRSITGTYSSTPQEETTYNFAILGVGKSMGGFVNRNSGTITNSYVKDVAIVNLNDFIDSKTAGFAVVNSNYIYSSFVEGYKPANEFRANSSIYIDAKSTIGGFVHDNQGKISNAYSNIHIKTTSGRSGGFVFYNSSAGVITNAYSASNNQTSGNSWSHGLFTGIDLDNQFNNYGIMESAFFMLIEGENSNTSEPAVAINATNSVSESSNSSNPFKNENSFNGFNFAVGSSNSENGIWTMGTGYYGPQLTNSLLYNNFSYRYLEEQVVDPNNPSAQIYNYDYHQLSYYGSANNPLLINTPTDFINIIINNSSKFTSNINTSVSLNIFGVSQKANSRRYVRLVNNLDFSNVVIEDVVLNNLRISDIIFVGSLDGNGMNMTNISLVDLKKDQQNENFGLFSQVGISDSQFREFIRQGKKENLIKPKIENLNLTIGRFDATSSVKVGALAGSIYDSNIINVKITGANNVVIQGRNLVGGFAGLINNKETYSLVGLNANNIWISSSYKNITILESDVVNSSGIIEGKTITSYANNPALLTNYSYAGTIAGVLVGNNRLVEDKIIKQSILSGDPEAEEAYGDINAHNRGKIGNISNISASGGSVYAMMAGGLFGYIGHNTRVAKASYTVLGDETSGQRIIGYVYAGGIVAENYGIIERSFVQHEKTLQNTYDTNLANGNINPQGLSSVFTHNLNNAINVAIGGIAGFSDSSIILDSYVKINVANAYSKIAGGLVGLATRQNYFSHIFVYGNVFAKNVFGGVVGLYNQSGTNITPGNTTPLLGKPNKVILYSNTNKQDNSIIDVINLTNAEMAAISLSSLRTLSGQSDVADYTIVTNNKLLLDYVVALNTWGPNAKTAVVNNVREYYKRMNVEQSGYYSNYNIIMQEVGNQIPTIAGINTSGLSPLELSRLDVIQNILTPSVFVGSLVGRIALSNIVYGVDTISGSDQRHLLLEAAINKAIVKSREVSLIDESNQIPTVISTTFSSADTIVTDNTTTNNWPTEASPSVHGDILGYANSVGTQIKLRGIIGKDEVGINYFTQWTMDAMSKTKLNQNSSSTVWKLQNTGVLPEFIVGIYSNYNVIENDNDFKTKLIYKRNTISQYFVLKPNQDNAANGYTYDITEEGYSVYNNMFAFDFKGILIGEEIEVGGNVIKPKIIFHLVPGRSSIFKNITSGVLSNIDFEIVVDPGANDYIDILNNGDIASINAGLFARDVYSSVISNVNITITGPNAVTFFRPRNGIQNFGVIFGSVDSSSVFNLSVSFKDQFGYDASNQAAFNNLTLNTGVLAAITSKTTFSKINIYGYDNDYLVKANTASANSNTVRVGGLIGYATVNTVLSNINTDYLFEPQIVKTLQIKVESIRSTSNLIVGGLVAELIDGNVTNVNYLGDIVVGSNGLLIVKTLNFGGLFGIVNSSDIANAQINSYVLNNSYNVHKDNDENLFNITVNYNALSGSNVGGIVGSMQETRIASQSIAINGITNYIYTNNASNINVTASYNSSTTTSNSNIGGIVGFVTNSRSQDDMYGLHNVLNTGNIEVIKTNPSKVTTYVGGIVGLSNGIRINETYSYGDISVNTNGKYSIGGVIGFIARSNYHNTIIRTMVYGDITNRETTVIQDATHSIGGIVGGSSSSLVTITDSMSLARINGINTALERDYNFVAGIGVGINDSMIQNVYYVFEFVPYFYQKGAVSYASLEMLNKFDYLTDLNNIIVGKTEEESKIVKTIFNITGLIKTSSYGSNSVIKLPWLVNMYELNVIDANCGNKLYGQYNKLNPNEVTNANHNIVSNGYNILAQSLNNFSSVVTNFNGVLVGKIINNGAGFYSINVSSALNARSFVNNNYGIIANVGVKDTSNKVSNANSYFVNNNQKGAVLLNVVAYGAIQNGSTANTGSFGGLVYNNSGNILSSGSSFMFNGSLSKTVSNYGFGAIAVNNNAGGIIKDVYSTTNIINESADIRFGGLVVNNQGRVFNSYYAGYVPSSTINTSNPMIYGGNGSHANVYYDHNALNLSVNNNFGKVTATLANVDNHGQLLNPVFVNNLQNINYGYATLIRGVKIYTNISANVRTTINTVSDVSMASYDVDNISYYSSSGYYGIYNSAMLTNLNNVTSGNGYLIFKNIDFSNYKATDTTKNDDKSKVNVLLADLSTRVFAGVGEFKEIRNIKALTAGYLFQNISSNSRVFNLKFININVDSDKSVGILAQNISNSSLSNLHFDAFNVKGKNQVGVVAGTYNQTSESNYYINNIYIGTNTTNKLTGSVEVGGLFGTASVATRGNVTVSNVEVKMLDIDAAQAAGGIIGSANNLVVYKVNSNTISFIRTNGSTRTGGSFGSLVTSHIIDVQARNISINAVNHLSYVGGFIGNLTGSTIVNVTVQNINISTKQHNQFETIQYYYGKTLYWWGYRSSQSVGWTNNIFSVNLYFGDGFAYDFAYLGTIIGFSSINNIGSYFVEGDNNISINGELYAYSMNVRKYYSGFLNNTANVKYDINRVRYNNISISSNVGGSSSKAVWFTGDSDFELVSKFTQAPTLSQDVFLITDWSFPYYHGVIVPNISFFQ